MYELNLRNVTLNSNLCHHNAFIDRNNLAMSSDCKRVAWAMLTKIFDLFRVFTTNVRKMTSFVTRNAWKTWHSIVKICFVREEWKKYGLYMYFLYVFKSKSIKKDCWFAKIFALHQLRYRQQITSMTRISAPWIIWCYIQLCFFCGCKYARN